MARIITKELAEKIADKLGATYENSGPHKMAYIWHNDLLIANFGIRRGSERDKGHDYVPRSIHLSPNQSRRLAQCQITKDGWIEIMMQKGVIERPASDETQDETGGQSAESANPET